MRFGRGRSGGDDGDRLAALAASRLVEWRYLDERERADLLAATAHLISAKSWEPARGFELTFAAMATIALHAALVTLALGVEEYRHVKAIVVHPSSLVVRTPRPGPVPGTLDDSPIELLGEAHGRQGPVLLAWDAVRSDVRHGARTGCNVVIHEFVHKLDMLDGLIDGTPPLAGAAAVARWARVSTVEYDRLRAGHHDPLLRDYAATDPGEFFAVAAEVFFTRPAALAESKPELYALYRDYFGQDPAARRSRTGVASGS